MYVIPESLAVIMNTKYINDTQITYDIFKSKIRIYFDWIQ